ncbi:epoxide hydrolase family protein [Rhodococcoides yunnanense]|uniref:epoxide hydrolase family protein n=1 Tax=Rhodococcoides yunnanense TaxID=278209 RepID=UPI000934671A|nr:epoxide hydrolase family protein [Rhodococcus yunnanensis]
MTPTPFRIDVPQTEVDELRRRLADTRWPDERPVGAESGISHATLGRLFRRWRDDYDWYSHQAELNRYPQIVTEIDGQKVHAVHARSERPDAVPVILLHGWPSTFAEYRLLIEPLITPPDESDPAFHVVIPSLPGFGFSTPVDRVGWNNPRLADAMAELMAQLGYDRYLVHGSDIGQAVGEFIATAHSRHVRGLHVHMGGVKLAGENASSEPRDDLERRAFAKNAEYAAAKAGYAVLQATRPDTLGYALTDSPIGQLAWIGEKFYEWGDPDHPVDIDDILTAVSIYWFTRTAASSARFYSEEYSTRSPRPYVGVPTAVSAFPHDIVPPVPRWADKEFHITQWTDMPAGGHFAALEVPELVLGSLRRFAASPAVASSVTSR